MKHTLLLILFLFLSFSLPLRLQAQYNLAGSAQPQPSEGCYLLTEDKTHQGGAVWNRQQINLQRSMTWQFTVNFGTRVADGADGIAFVLQNRGPNVVAQTGEYFGFTGISPSLGIEFDTHINPTDPSFDHMAIQRDGNVNHFSPLNLAGPVRATRPGATLKDGRNHTVKVQWDATRKRLEVQIDCEKLAVNIDLVNEIFGGNPNVWWGVSASTGGATNNQSVCFPTHADTVGRRQLTACPKETVQLIAPESVDLSYSWTPRNLLSDPEIRIPTTQLAQTQLFRVTYRNQCGELAQDSVLVTVKPLPKIQPDPDSLNCLRDRQARLKVSSSESGLTFLWPHSGEQTAEVVVTQPGTFEARVTGANGCTASQVFTVKDTCFAPVSVFMPTIFTPNGDGVNDLFEIRNANSLDIRLTILNRWGEVIFYTTDPRQSWDGTYKRKQCLPDRYAYILQYRDSRNPGDPFQLEKGTVVLTR